MFDGLEDKPDILTAALIAGYLKLSPRRVYELMDIAPEAGGIPSFRIGKSKRVFKGDFENWLDDKRGAIWRKLPFIRLGY